MKYKNLFIDLDDTVYNFTENSRDVYHEVFDLLHYERFFDSFETYFSIYSKQNTVYWAQYGDGKITKQELNHLRYLYPLQAINVNDEELADTFCRMALERMPSKGKLMPYAKEVLIYLQPKYNLYILTNGFRELQEGKMHTAGINGFFKKIILSEDIHVNKPHPELFRYALEVTKSQLQESLMIGDHFEVDIEGAAGIGMDQMYYNLTRRKELPFVPTYEISSLKEILYIL